MAKIAIVDDNREQRESLRIELKLYLKKRNSSLEVIDLFPFQNYSDYYPWIDNQEICVLILDERLHNESEDGHEPVGYRGNDLVVKIRERYKDLPIFTVTAHIEDEALQARFNEFDYIISRDGFNEKYVDIIIRASQRYLTENQKELSEFDDLSKRIASGEGNDEDFEKLKAIQLKLQLPLFSDLKDREDWLREYESQIKALESIKQTIESRLRNK